MPSNCAYCATGATVGLRHARTEEPRVFRVSVEMNECAGDLGKTARHPVMGNTGRSMEMPLKYDYTCLLGRAG